MHQYLIFVEMLEAKGWKLKQSIPTAFNQYRHIYTHKQYKDDSYMEFYHAHNKAMIKIWVKQQSDNYAEVVCYDNWTKQDINQYLSTKLPLINQLLTPTPEPIIGQQIITKAFPTPGDIAAIEDSIPEAVKKPIRKTKVAKGKNAS